MKRLASDGSKLENYMDSGCRGGQYSIIIILNAQVEYVQTGWSVLQYIQLSRVHTTSALSDFLIDLQHAV
jgi:hypothetical protein